MALYANYRRNPFTHSYNGQTKYQVAYVTNSGDFVDLQEIAEPGTVEVKLKEDMSSFTESNSYPPGSNQYYVDYIPDSAYKSSYADIESREGTNKISINVSQRWVIIKYTGLGKVADYIDFIKSYNNSVGFNPTATLSTWYLGAATQTTTRNRSIITPTQRDTPLFIMGCQDVFRRFDIFDTFTNSSWLSLSLFNYPDINNSSTERVHMANSQAPLTFITYTASTGGQLDYSSGGAVPGFTIGTKDGCSVQVGDYVYYTDGSNLKRTSLLRSSSRTITSLGYTWEYGASAYDGNGNVYLMGNRESSNIGKSLKINIYEETVSNSNTLSSNTRLCNGSSIIRNGMFYGIDEYGLSQGYSGVFYNDIINGGVGYNLNMNNNSFNYQADMHKYLTGCAFNDLLVLPYWDQTSTGIGSYGYNGIQWSEIPKLENNQLIYRSYENNLLEN